LARNKAAAWPDISELRPMLPCGNPDSSVSAAAFPD
jgi:hypothetical protein